MSELFVHDGGTFRQALPLEVLDQARAAASEYFKHGDQFCPEHAKTYLKARLNGLKREVSGVLLLDPQMKLIADIEVFAGTLTTTVSAARDIVRIALDNNAFGVVQYHNHPGGGQSLPSDADKSSAQTLNAALSLFDMHLMDAYVVGDEVYSLRDHEELMPPDPAGYMYNFMKSLIEGVRKLNIKAA